MAADIDFLAMDLDFHGFRDLGRYFVEGFAAASRDPELLLVLDFYKCYRAYVRGKIHAFTAQDPTQAEASRDQALKTARAYFALAGEYAQAGDNGPLIVVVFGLMGSGKSSRSRALAASLGWPVIHSDAVRKGLAGLKPTDRVPVAFGAGIYGEDYSARTYAEMLCIAETHLAAGQSVILDGSYKRDRERQRVRRLARDQGARAVFVYCECPPEVARERLGIRLTDPEAISNGRVELFEDQMRDFDPFAPEDRPLLRLDTNRDPQVVLADLKNFVTCFLDEGEPDES